MVLEGTLASPFHLPKTLIRTYGDVILALWPLLSLPILCVPLAVALSVYPPKPFEDTSVEAVRGAG